MKNYILAAAVMLPAAANAGFYDAPADDKLKLSAQGIAPRLEVALKNNAGSILTWRDVNLSGAEFGVEKKNWGLNFWYAMGGGYQSDDDMNISLNSWSNGKVDTKYYGFDAWKNLSKYERVDTRWGVRYSRIELDRTGKKSLKATTPPSNQLDLNATNHWKDEIVDINTLVAYYGGTFDFYRGNRSKMSLDASIGAGVLYNQMDWRNSSGMTGIKIDTYGLGLASMSATLNYEWAFVDTAALTLAAGIRHESLWLGDISRTDINQKALTCPSDPRCGKKDSSGSFIKDFDTNEAFWRIGLKAMI
ncbi:MAG: hypothetical protein LBL46_02220 [Rickettsiales bacterium]|jgi:hypothetical protein|nr:hypothetical protein [Rickettsiales bacterium]